MKLKFSAFVAFAIIGGLGIQAQNRTYFGGGRNAFDYAFGIAPGVSYLQVAPGGGTTTTGTGTLTLAFGNVTAADGTVFNPFTLLNGQAIPSVTVGVGTNADTVTPTAVSCLTPQIYTTCAITASFNHTHGPGEIVTSGSLGLQEALNFQFLKGGGKVLLDYQWAAFGGTNAIITAATPYSSVFIEDLRGQSNTAAYGTVYWTMQPSTLTSLAVPTTLTGTTAVFSATPAGTWTNAAQFACVTYVDALGGEGPCSATFNQTPAASTSLTITSPAASTGAVGWRAYAGASYNGAFLLPITSATCTLSTLETVFPACAIGSAGFYPAIFVNTAILRPNAQAPTTALNLPMPQGHTTFAYQPSGLPGTTIFQDHYGPFPAFGSTSAATNVLASAQFPINFMNSIGRVVRVYGKLALSETATGTVAVNIQLGWAGGTTAGAPVTICAFPAITFAATTTDNFAFNCTLTTNAVGATAIGTLMPDGVLNTSTTAGASGQTATDTGVAAVGSLGLFAQDTVYVSATAAVAAMVSSQVTDLHIEVLQ